MSSSKGLEALEDLANTFGGKGAALGDQAEAVWAQLNEAHECNPASYQHFIQKQMNRMKEETKEGNNIVPRKGFVVKGFTEGDTRKKLFVNMCQHEAVRCPLDKGGMQLDINASLANIEIPLVVSAVRCCSDGNGAGALAVDVIFNPWCFSRSDLSADFKDDLTNLAILAIREDRNLCLDTDWKYIKSQYKGGSGSAGVNVTPFSLGKGEGNESDDASAALESIMENPSSLLRTLTNTDKEKSNNDFSLKTAKVQNGKKKLGILIEEIGTKSNENRKDVEKIAASGRNEVNIAVDCELVREVSSHRNPCPKSKSLSLDIPLAKQMKGFLNKGRDKSKPLSEELRCGSGTGKLGEGFSSLVSKCEVVGTTELEVCKESKEETEHGSVDVGAVHDMISSLTVNAGMISSKNAKDRSNPALPFIITHSTDTALSLEVDLSNTLVTCSSDLTIETIENCLTLTTKCGKQLCYSHPLVCERIAAKFKRKQKSLILSTPS